jgi:hypothetical protein
MLDFVWGVLAFLLRAVDFVLESWVFVSRLRRFGKIAVTGRLDTDEEIKVPRDPLPPAAERALAEAEERRRKGPA